MDKNNMLCSRCKKRLAVIYMTRMENGQTVSEGLCLKCAKELGLKPVDDLMNKMGLSEEDLNKMSDEMMATIIEGLGGADNIQHVDACFTRLRVKVKDKALVMPDTDWKQKTGANGVVQVADGVQIIYGAKADIYKNNLKSALNMD